MRTFLVRSGWSLLALLVLAAAGLWIASAYVRAHTDWPPPRPEVRITPTRPLLTPDDITTNNAFYFIRETTNYVARWDFDDWTRFSSNGWQAGAYTNLDAQFVLAAPQLDLLARAAAMSNGQVESMVSFTQVIPYISRALQLGRLQAYEMARAFGEGRSTDALAVAGRVMANNAHLERGAPLIGRLVVVASDQVILSGLHRALANGQLPPAALRPAAELLGQRSAGLEPWSEALRYEALSALDALRYAYDGQYGLLIMAGNEQERAREHPLLAALLRLPLSLVGSTPARTRAHMESVYQHLIERADEPWRLREFERTAPIMQPLAFTSRRWYLDDPLGRVLTALLVPAIASSADRFYGDVAGLRTLHALLLAEAHRQEHGDWPARLDDLVSAGGLTGLPRDPFVASGTLRYLRTNDTLTVYSVGPNEQDDGGNLDTPVPYDNRPPDLGWRIELGPEG